MIILCIGEESYAEWFGDTTDLSLNGNTCLTGNMDAIYKAREYGKPVVTCIVAGRLLFLGKSYYDNWDSVVMCYLPCNEFPFSPSNEYTIFERRELYGKEKDSGKDLFNY